MIGRHPVSTRKLPWRRIVTGVAAFLLLRHTVTFGTSDVTFTFTLVNGTPHFLHAVINNQSHAYLSPGGSIAAEISAYGVVIADVRYSPGQGVRGEKSRIFKSECTTTTTSTYGTSTDCNQSSTDCGETTSAGSSTTTVSCNPITWSVVPAELDSTGGVR